jgi:hypothetical protein
MGNLLDDRCQPAGGGRQQFGRTERSARRSARLEQERDACGRARDVEERKYTGGR